LAEAQGDAKKLVDQLKANPQPFLVHHIELGDERKGVAAIQQIFKDSFPQMPVMIVSSSPKETMIMCAVPKGHAKIKASEWCKSASEKLGGRGGGTDVAAQATIQGDKSKEVVDLTTQFASVTLQ